MEDFKGYIFMIIAILSAIVSIYQKSKKKGQQAKTLSSPRPKPLDPWKGVFDTDDETTVPQSFDDDEYDGYLEPEAVSESLDPHSDLLYGDDKSIKRQSTSHLSRASVPDMRDGLAVSKHIHISKIDTLDIDDSRHIDVSLDTPTDWQRAFIYSEIFDRKY